MNELSVYPNILDDDLQVLEPFTFVTFGETMVRETPADMERPERTRNVYLSMAGSEFTVAIALSRLGIPAEYITRVPENPYGRAVRNIARENGVNTSNFVWAPMNEPIGRMIYEIGRTPRKSTVYYQRMYSAASKFDSGMVNWKNILQNTKLFHVSGISFSLATHSQYKRNFNLEAFREALSQKPDRCLVGLDFNFRSTLWSKETARKVLTPILTNNVDVFITTIEDMASFYNIDCGQYSASQVLNGEVSCLTDDDLKSFSHNVMNLFNLKILGITIRYPDSFEQNRWESFAMDNQGNYFRSPRIHSITLLDRLGGGDAWTAGFYYGLLTEGFNKQGVKKGIYVGDAATRIAQTLMFDLPIFDKEEIDSLLKSDELGGGIGVSR